MTEKFSCFFGVHKTVNLSKRRVNFILGKRNWVKYCTKKTFKSLKVVLIGFSVITITAVIKYKPVYAVTLAGKTIGYVADKEKTEQKVKDYINDKSGNIAFRVAADLPEYDFIFVDRKEKDAEQDVLLAVQNATETTYQTYAITLDGEKKVEVSSEEEANQIVEKIKEGVDEKVGMKLGIEKVYSTTLAVTSKEEAESKLNEIKTEKVNAYETKKAEEAKKAQLAKAAARSKAFASTTTLAATGEISGMSLSIPVSGSISSRFGERSSSRSSVHTGLDIAAPMGTGVRAISEGTVVFAAYNGSYGNLIKVDHGNGVQSWYAHCSAIYVGVGQTVSSATTIAAVGSTGNSTGPHLHLEIRVGGSPVNPQNYLYR